MTNAEKIQTMNIEELVDYISELCDCSECNCPVYSTSISCATGCKEAWRKYLVREAE